MMTSMTQILDLHGKTQDEAIVFLEKQIALLKLQGEVRVVVITGRGHHSKAGVDKGTLQSKVPLWLKGVQFKSLVASVSQIPDNPGAFLVSIKKIKAKPPKFKIIKA